MLFFGGWFFCKRNDPSFPSSSFMYSWLFSLFFMVLLCLFLHYPVRPLPKLLLRLLTPLRFWKPEERNPVRSENTCGREQSMHGRVRLRPFSSAPVRRRLPLHFISTGRWGITLPVNGISS